MNLNVPFEIIVLDDASGEPWNQLNGSIQTWDHCILKTNTSNVGRAAARNILAHAANYPWLIYLDADVQIKNPSFLLRYLEVIQTSTAKVIYGSCTYPLEKPKDPAYRLHWMYGTKIENPDVRFRKLDPYKTFHTVNFAVEKKILLEFPFYNVITTYGYEDQLWASVLKLQKIDILHIDNPVVHLGIHPTRQFLRNTVSAVRNLIRINKYNPVQMQTSLSKVGGFLLKFRLDRLVFFLYKKFEKKIIKNLRSENPNLLHLQTFKLGIYLRFWNKS